MNIHFLQGQNDLFATLESDSEKERIEIIKSKIGELFNLKNVHFLFGSGTSAEAIPTMKSLFKKVESVVAGKSIKQKEEFKNIKNQVGEEDLEKLLGSLYSNRSYLDGYAGKEKQLKVCEDLIATIEKVIFDEINIDLTDPKFASALDLYRKFYQKSALRNKDMSRLNIFTTNNDLLSEVALSSINIHYINGFNGGLNRFFNPALFSYTFSKRMDTSIEKFEPVENLVNLYKIHGSVNWIEDDSNANSFFKIREIIEPKKAGNNVLIYPNPIKQNKSLGSPYVEMFRELKNRLLEPLSVLFVIGYSFNDEHVNNSIYQALATNTSLTLFIINDISSHPLSEVDDDRIFRLWGEVDEDGKEVKIHYFDYIVNKLLPNVNAFRSDSAGLSKFIQFYNEILSK